MLFRSMVCGALVLGAGLGWMVATNPSFMVGLGGADVLAVYEKAGIDVGACKDRLQSLINPRGGSPDCLEGSFRDIENKLRGADQSEFVESRQEPHEAPSAEEPEL